MEAIANDISILPSEKQKMKARTSMGTRNLSPSSSMSKASTGKFSSAMRRSTAYNSKPFSSQNRKHQSGIRTDSNLGDYVSQTIKVQARPNTQGQGRRNFTHTMSSNTTTLRPATNERNRHDSSMCVFKSHFSQRPKPVQLEPRRNTTGVFSFSDIRNSREETTEKVFKMVKKNFLGRIEHASRAEETDEDPALHQYRSFDKKLANDLQKRLSKGLLPHK